MTETIRIPAFTPLVRRLAVALVATVAFAGVMGCGKRDHAPGAGAQSGSAADVSLLHVSYDPTRELFDTYNKEFAQRWEVSHHQKVTVKQSHGGSGKQARAVIDGLQADVVSLALPYDVDALQRVGKLIPENWSSRLPNRSVPFTSTIVLVVRKGNPKGIRDWGDLVKGDVQVITPNPKTSGGARYNYLAAWGYALRQPGGTPETARAFVKALYEHVPVLDAGARGATTTFVERGIGDVLLAWENEALLSAKEHGDRIEVVVPSVSIVAEPTLAWVDPVVAKKKSGEVAQAYLKSLFEPWAQELAARNFYRPSDPAVAAKVASTFPKLQLFGVDEVFGGWGKAQKEHFDDDGVFDQIKGAQ